jgi:hypothetical protein
MIGMKSDNRIGVHVMLTRRYFKGIWEIKDKATHLTLLHLAANKMDYQLVIDVIEASLQNP